MMISTRIVSPRASSRGCWPRLGFGRERFGRFPAAYKLKVSKAITGHSSKRRGSHIARTAHRHNRAISGICTERRPSHAVGAKMRKKIQVFGVRPSRVYEKELRAALPIVLIARQRPRDGPRARR